MICVQNVLTAKTSEEVERIKVKNMLLGREAHVMYKDAIYCLNGNSVLLEEVLTLTGTFTIPEFVSGLYRINSESVYAFRNCRSLKIINNSQKITDLSYMFSFSAIQNLDLSCFNTFGVTNMRGMFEWCGCLTEVNLSGINTSSVTDMSRMFMQCDHLEKIDMSSFDISPDTDTTAMLVGCDRLKCVIMPDSNVETDWSAELTKMFHFRRVSQ